MSPISLSTEPGTTYLDHAATTPMLPEAVAVMAEALMRTGNASSLHSAGRRSRRLVEESRERIAAAVGARPSEVVLTTGGTESDNLAVKGLYWARRPLACNELGLPTSERCRVIASIAAGTIGVVAAWSR